MALYLLLGFGIFKDLMALAFSLPFAYIYLLLNIYLINKLIGKGSQIILLLLTVFYLSWFTFLVIDAFVVHLDAQSGIVIIIAPVYAFPVMVLGWIAASFFNDRKDESRISRTHRSKK